MSPPAARLDYEQTLSSLLETYARMERDNARETDWINLEVAVYQAFADAQRVFLDAAVQQVTGGDVPGRTQQHMDELVSLRKRIEQQVALAKIRDS